MDNMPNFFPTKVDGNSTQTTKRRKTTEATMETQLPFLPMEVIASILSRVPVKPLLKFRVVCKSWRSLISSTSFAAMHLERAKLNPFFLEDKHRRYPRLNHHLLFSKYREAVVKFRYLDPTIQGKKEKILVGSKIWMQTSLDGLICFLVKGTNYGEPTIHVVNPATRERVDLPSEYFDLIELCQLLQDPETLRYKVLVVYKVAEGMSESKIFTLGVDQQWRDLPSCPHNSWKLVFPVLQRPHVNGRVHWISEGPRPRHFHIPANQYNNNFIINYDNNHDAASSSSSTSSGNKRFIVAFDIHREEYDVITYPPNYCDEASILNDEDNRREEADVLVESQGCLHLLHFRQSLNAVDVWVLTDYQNKIWERQLRMPVNFREHRGIYGPQCQELAAFSGLHVLWTSGILSNLPDSPDILVYIPRDRIIGRMHLRGDELVMRGTYVESLVSINSIQANEHE